MEEEELKTYSCDMNEFIGFAFEIAENQFCVWSSSRLNSVVSVDVDFNS